MKWTNAGLIEWFQGTAEMTEQEHHIMMSFKGNQQFRKEAILEAKQRGLDIQLRSSEVSL